MGDGLINTSRYQVMITTKMHVFILIEQVNQQSKMKKKTIQQLLEDRDDHWMKKLKTVAPKWAK